MPFHQQIIPVQIGKGHLRAALFMPNLMLIRNAHKKLSRTGRTAQLTNR